MLKHHMILTVLGIIVLGIGVYVAFQGIRFYLLVQESKKLVAKSQHYEQNVDTGTPRILVAGDSTAVGTGTTPEGSTTGHFGAEFPKASISNISRNGMKVAELAQIFTGLKSNSYDLIVLQIGANDIIQGTQMDAFKQSLGQLFTDAKRVGTNVVALHSGNIGLAPMFPWPINLLLRSRTLTYRALYQQVAAKNGVIYVDLYEEAANDPFKDRARFYAPDDLHLTSDGYGVWYQAIRKAMDTAGIHLH